MRKKPIEVDYIGNIVEFVYNRTPIGAIYFYKSTTRLQIKRTVKIPIDTNTKA